ncbi:carboxylesterase/lipase family protein [Streptomyces sp. NPDC004393]|uniref:carboxylesterase/lipase family protein n=1 Tax=Streptomyces sp. NPDC004533 TaxID=3154278 RepID=UPI0033B00AE4
MALSEPEIRTTAGALRGRWEGGVAVFLGIPFAQPPVGAARFAAPRPVTGWDGVREAFSYGPPPPQAAALGPVAPRNKQGDDDWLTVNVWSPAPDKAARLPVTVWIGGGAYMVGSSGDDGYDGGRLAGDGGVVVVTFNYRLGIEGFAQIQGAPSNRGLLDQVAALEWVRENIAHFGGDPTQVTIFGESSGAGCIAALLAMERARGLFRRAIAHSVPGTFFAPDLADDFAAAFAAHLGLRPTVPDLSGVDPDELPAAGDAVAATLAAHEDRWGQLAHYGNPFAPVVDGDVLPAAPWQALADGAGRGVELVTGHTRDEFRIFLAMSGLLGKITDEQAATELRVFAPGPNGERAYRDAFADATAEQLYEIVRSDWLFRMPTLHLAEAQAAGGGRAHLFDLAWPAPGMGGVLGACHGLDVPLTFGRLDAGIATLLIGPAPSPPAEALSVQLWHAWTTFAATGDPGWPAYDLDRRLTWVLDIESKVAAYPEETSRLLWRDHTFKALPLTATQGPSAASL